MGKGLRCFVAAVFLGFLFVAIPPSPALAGIENTLGMVFITVPGGEFEMGDNNGFTDEDPAHRVRISEFQLMKREVTQAQWAAVMGINPSYYKNCDDCPVEQVSWDDAQEFVRKASAQTGLPLRLPSEAEWEYAAGGGAQHQKWPGTGNEAEVGKYAWIVNTAGRKTHPGCQKLPNALGLCDMSGNVMEWVADFYGDYPAAAADNPSGPTEGVYRVIRGGSINRGEKFARTAAREAVDPSRRFVFVGFRLALPAGQR
ncbi:MAG: formylglycine-generating enzyme family protein [Candidatus Methylomirabilia bacterium]